MLIGMLTFCLCKSDFLKKTKKYNKNKKTKSTEKPEKKEKTQIRKIKRQRYIMSSNLMAPRGNAPSGFIGDSIGPSGLIGPTSGSLGPWGIFKPVAP